MEVDPISRRDEQVKPDYEEEDWAERINDILKWELGQARKKMNQVIVFENWKTLTFKNVLLSWYCLFYY
jgi:hypothetical protein